MEARDRRRIDVMGALLLPLLAQLFASHSAASQVYVYF